MPAKPNILIVDDCAMDIALLEEGFQNAGDHVNLCAVRDGEEAIEYLEGSGKFRDRATFPLPRLIILDIKMPKVDGFDVLEWRVQHPNFKRVPVVMLSSSSQSRDIERAYDLGANSFLSKPSNLAEYTELASLLRSYWGEWNCAPEFVR